MYFKMEKDTQASNILTKVVRNMQIISLLQRLSGFLILKPLIIKELRGLKKSVNLRLPNSLIIRPVFWLVRILSGCYSFPGMVNLFFVLYFSVQSLTTCCFCNSLIISTKKARKKTKVVKGSQLLDYQVQFSGLTTT